MTQIFIPGEFQLEAVHHNLDPARAGLVAHPHPLYGGSMHNNVVAAAARALEDSGLSSLIFNFRGVGASAGVFDEGRGEQDDLASAARFLKDQGAERPLVIGYSFGAWTAAFAWPKLKALGVPPLILIAPPAAFMSFEGLSPDTEIGLIICGQYDDIAPPKLAEDLGRRLTNPIEPQIIPGTDHFFGGYEKELTARLSEHLKNIPQDQ